MRPPSQHSHRRSSCQHGRLCALGHQQGRRFRPRRNSRVRSSTEAIGAGADGPQATGRDQYERRVELVQARASPSKPAPVVTEAKSAKSATHQVPWRRTNTDRANLVAVRIVDCLLVRKWHGCTATRYRIISYPGAKNISRTSVLAPNRVRSERYRRRRLHAVSHKWSAAL